MRVRIRTAALRETGGLFYCVPQHCFDAYRSAGIEADSTIVEFDIEHIATCHLLAHRNPPSIR